MSETNDVNHIIRLRMRAELEQREMTLSDLARSLGVSHSHVSQLMSGKRGIVPSSLVRALAALGLELTVSKKK